MRQGHRAAGAICLLLGAAGCAGTVEVTRTYTPDAASQVQSEKVVPVAIVRANSRIALPRGARIQDRRVIVPRTYTHKLAPGDVIEQDELGRIVAVRSADHPPVVSRFIPGTAQSPAASDEVRGELAAEDAGFPLERGDGVEMHGTLKPDDAVTGVGHVEASRFTGALVGGVVLLALSYGPSVYVGAQSSQPYDRALEIPVAGPWLDLAGRPTCVAPSTPIKPPVDPCLFETASRVALVASGAAQGLGALLTIIGLPSQSELVDGDRGVGSHTKPHVALLPSLYGAVAVGTF